MSRLLKRQRGFTLIELLIVIAIIGIIAAILIPNFLDSLQKAKQKRTMGDMKDMGTAWFAWLTDQFGAAAAAGGETTYSMPDEYGISDLENDLLPNNNLTPPFAGYIQEIPRKDAWQNDYIFCRADDPVRAPRVMAIVSPGRDGTVDNGCGTDVTFGAFEPTDYDQDIVWADGFFVRFPQKVLEEGAGGGG